MHGPENIIFKAAFGDEVKNARLSVYWGTTWYLFLDDFLHALVTKRDGTWLITDQANRGLYTSTDADVLGEIIELQWGNL